MIEIIKSWRVTYDICDGFLDVTSVGERPLLPVGWVRRQPWRIEGAGKPEEIELCPACAGKEMRLF
jgi:hypothetical protein